MNLVLLHYFGGSMDAWNPLYDAMSDNVGALPAGLSLSPLNVPSFATDAPSIEGIGSEILEFLDRSVQEPTILVGHSMGAKLALWMAAQQPEQLRGVVLLAPSPPSPEPMDEMARDAMLYGFGSREAAVKTLKSASHRELPSEIFEEMVEANLRTPDKHWKWWLEDGSKQDISDLLPKITVPSLVIVGAHDERMTADLMEREITSKLPNSQLEEVAGAGHLLPLESPDAVAALIMQWLGQISAR